MSEQAEKTSPHITISTLSKVRAAAGQVKLVAPHTQLMKAHMKLLNFSKEEVQMAEALHDFQAKFAQEAANVVRGGRSWICQRLLTKIQALEKDIAEITIQIPKEIDPVKQVALMAREKVLRRDYQDTVAHYSELSDSIENAVIKREQMEVQREAIKADAYRPKLGFQQLAPIAMKVTGNVHVNDNNGGNPANGE